MSRADTPDLAELLAAWAKPFPVVLEIAVAWGEMDAFQHLNNAVYFRYAESTRIEYFRRVGLAQAMVQGVGPILAETRCRFKAPVTFPDTISAGVRVASLGADRFEMVYSLWSQKLRREAAAIWATLVTYDYGQGKKAPVPPEVARAIRELEHSVGNAVEKTVGVQPPENGGHRGISG